MIFPLTPFETSNIYLLIGLLFVAGMIEDVLETWVTFTVVKRQTIRTCLITFFGIIIEFTVFLSFISNLDKWPVIISYAVGATVGTACVVEFQKRAKRKKRAQDKVRRQLRATRKKKQEQREAAKAAKAKKILTSKKLVPSIVAKQEPLVIVPVEEPKVEKRRTKPDEKPAPLGKSDPVEPSA